MEAPGYLAEVTSPFKTTDFSFFSCFFSAVQNNNNQTLDNNQEEQKKKFIIDIYRNKNQNQEMGSIISHP